MCKPLCGSIVRMAARGHHTGGEFSVGFVICLFTCKILAKEKDVVLLLYQNDIIT